MDAQYSLQSHSRRGAKEVPSKHASMEGIDTFQAVSDQLHRLVCMPVQVDYFVSSPNGWPMKVYSDVKKVSTGSS